MQLGIDTAVLLPGDDLLQKATCETSMERHPRRLMAYVKSIV